MLVHGKQNQRSIINSSLLVASVIPACLIHFHLCFMVPLLFLIQMRRERFVEELESYSKQLEEFQSFGDMQEIQRYLKKAQALNQRLESASDKVRLLLQTLLCKYL